MAKHQTDRRESRATFVESRKDRIIYRMVNKENRKRCITCGSYFAVFAIGVIVGLVPFMLQYIKETQADREVLKQFVQQQDRIFNLTAKNPSVMALSSKAKKIIRKKSGSARSNKSIELSCRGKIGIAALKWNEISASQNTVKLISKYCNKNMVVVDALNTCFVNIIDILKLKVHDPRNFITVDYTCEETI